MTPAAVVMARAPRPGQAKTRLEPLLGAEGCARLQAALIRRATAWASEVAPGAAFVAYTPADAVAELVPLVQRGTYLFAQAGGHLGRRLEHATRHVLSVHPGPLLVVGTDLPTLGAAHARAALAELARGHDVCFGPAEDGGYYLAALSRSAPAAFGIEPRLWGGPEVLSASVAAAQGGGLSVGLIATERDLDDPADARALLADPRLAPEVAALLRAPVAP